MPPIIIAAAIAGTAAVGGALISSNAAGNAANVAANAAAQNNALEQQIYDSNKGLAMPYIDRGNAAGTELSGFLGLGGDPAASQAAFNTYLKSTGYQFDFNQGLDAVTQSKAAEGLLNSGATIKALDDYGTGTAQRYGQAYVGNLSDVSKTGESAVNALTGAGQNYASQVSANNNSAATVSANAGLAAAGQTNNLISNAFSAFGYARGNLGQTSFGGGSNQGAMNAFSPSMAGAW